MQPAQRPTIAHVRQLFNEQSSTTTYPLRELSHLALAGVPEPFTHAAQQIGLSMAFRQEVTRGLVRRTLP
jgi:hypothetical protein